MNPREQFDAVVAGTSFGGKTGAHLKIRLDTMIARYIERQEATPTEVRERLQYIREHFNPDGFMLLECQMMDSSRLGELVILPFGGNSTFKEVPNNPISPRGVASDMSTVVAIADVGELP